MKERPHSVILDPETWFKKAKPILKNARSIDEVQSVVANVTDLSMRSTFFAHWAVKDEWRQAGVVEGDEKSVPLFLIDFDPVNNWRWFLTQDNLLFKEKLTDAGWQVTVGQPTDWLHLKDQFLLAISRELVLAKARGGPRSIESTS